MASFMMAMTINQDSRKVHPDVTHQLDHSLELFTKHELHVVKLYATLGRYDYIVLFDAFDQTEAFKVAGEINALGTVSTETWPLIEYEDFTRLVG